MGWKKVYRKDVKTEVKCCTNCKYATENRLKQPHGICPRAIRIRNERNTYIREMGFKYCWEAYNGSTSCNEKK